MNLKAVKRIHFTLIFLFFTLLFSCTKILTTDIGSGLIPPVDGVNTKDTIIEVITKNTGFDTASVGISENNVLGYVNDPVFGTTKASLNFQIAPAFTPFKFTVSKDSIFLDSVVLCLKYSGVWGDSLEHQKFHVYNIDPEEVFSSDSFYRSTKTFEKGQELTEFNTAKEIDITRLNDIDTTAFYREPATSQIRIRLNNSFGQQLIDYNSSVYTSDSTFYTYLRGLIVEPEATGEALLLVNLLDTSTHLSLYYRRLNTTGKFDTITTRYSPNVLSSASANSIIRNYQGTQIPAYFSGDPNANDDLLFLQTTPGTYSTLKIPGVLAMPNVIVHRAEILMYQVPDIGGDDDVLKAPNLFLSAYSKDSNRRFAIPYDVVYFGGTINNLTQFGITPRTETVSGTAITTYTFDISRYVQNVITRNDSLYDMVLQAPYSQYIFPVLSAGFAFPISTPPINPVAAGRVRLGGGSNSQYRMKLHIVYSLP